MPSKAIRGLRIVLIYMAALAVLFVRFVSGAIRETEADAFVQWALLPIGCLLGLGAASLDITGTGPVSRRDMLWGIGAGLITFSILRFAKVV
jgi:hypothetical protein